MLLSLFRDTRGRTQAQTHTQSHGQIFAYNPGFQLSQVSVFDETTRFSGSVFFFVFLVSSLNRVGEKHSAHSAKLLIQAYSMQRQFP